MHTHTMTPASSAPAGVYPSGQWLYDEIMQHIEPELLTDQIGTLEEKYAEETAQQRTERLEWYTVAFLLFEIALASFDDRMRDDALLMAEDLEAAARGRMRLEDQEKLHSLERALSDDSHSAL